MVIDNEQLIALLADKTDGEPVEIKEYLAELVKNVQDSVEQGKPYRIEGFGVFSTEEGRLQFTPDQVLQTEINNKYAGMKPIELIGAFKEPETGEMPEMTAEMDKEEEVWAFDQALASAEEKDEEPDEENFPEEEFPVLSEEAPQEPGEPKEEDNNEPATPPPVEAPDQDQQTVPALTVEETSSSEPSEKPAVASPETAPGDNVADSSNDKRDNAKGDRPLPGSSDKDPIGRYLAIAVSLLVIGVTGWLGYEFLSENHTNNNDGALSDKSAEQGQVTSQPVSSLQSEDDQVDSEEQQNSAVQDPASDEGNIEERNEESSEPEEPSQVINSEGSLSESSQNKGYGLRGDVVNSFNSWYTIVVHSLTDSSKAEANRAQLESEGYRAMIKQVQLAETLQYRVGIGQFPTIEEALSAAGELPEPYKSNNFIKRF